MDMKSSEPDPEKKSESEASSKASKRDRKKGKGKSKQSQSKEKKSSKPEWIRQINQLPMKSLSWIASLIGAFIFIGYMVHIGEQPELDAINLPMLFGRVFYCGAIVCLGLAMLYVPALLGTYLANDEPLPTGEKSVDEPAKTKSRLVNLGLFLAAEFLFPIFVLSIDQKGRVDTQSWYVWLSLTMLCAAMTWLFFKFKLSSIKAKIIAAKALEAIDAKKSSKKKAKEATAEPNESTLPDSPNNPIRRRDLVIEFLKHFGTLVIVGFIASVPMLILFAILDVAPKTVHSGWFDFWITWTVIALTNAVFALTPEISFKERLGVGAGAILYILMMMQEWNLPFDLAIRLAGLGQIAHANLELSSRECEDVLRKLNQEGITGKLICKSGGSDDHSASAGDQGPRFNGDVLKDVLILSNVGKNYFVEITVQKDPNPAAHDDAKGKTDQKMDKDFTGALREPVIKIHIPKSEADEVTHAENPIQARQFFGSSTHKLN